MYIPKWIKIGRLAGLVLRRVTVTGERNRVLLLSPGSLGDTLLFYGVLKATLELVPQKEFVVVISDEGEKILPSTPQQQFSNIRLVILPYSKRANSSIRERWRRIRTAIQIFRWRYQMVLNMAFTCGSLTHMVCAMADASQKVWFERGITSDMSDKMSDFTPADIYTSFIKTEPDMHELDRMASIINGAGLANLKERKDILPELALTKNERHKAAVIIEQCRKRMKDDVLLVALCCGARFKLKDWGTLNFVRLVQQITSVILQKKICILLIGGLEDRKKFDEIVRSVYSPDERVVCLNMAGELTPRESAALIEQCDVCAGNDTFGLHVAVVTGTPSVVVMWGGDFPNWIPWKNPELHRMVYYQMPCYGCHGKCRYAEPKCITEITVESVLNEFLEVLNIS